MIATVQLDMVRAMDENRIWIFFPKIPKMTPSADSLLPPPFTLRFLWKYLWLGDILGLKRKIVFVTFDSIFWNPLCYELAIFCDLIAAFPSSPAQCVQHISNMKILYLLYKIFKTKTKAQKSKKDLSKTPSLYKCPF